MASDPNTITAILARMEKAGWLVRAPHERDRRAHRVKIRPAGEETFGRAREIALRLQGQILAVLPEERREPFLAELEAIAQRCAEVPGEEPASDPSRLNRDAAGRIVPDSPDEKLDR